MPFLDEETLKQHNSYLTQMESERASILKQWKKLDINYLPTRYRYLGWTRGNESKEESRRYILNSTPTQAARTLAAGMMDGITSPSRPWFKLHVPGFDVEEHHELAIWLEDAEKKMQRVMSNSNFYLSMITAFLDLSVFGSAALLVYDDFDTVIRCYNSPLGEFYFGSGGNGQINRFGRKFTVKANQYVERWPDRRFWSSEIENAMRNQTKNLSKEVEICHYIGPNRDGIVPDIFSHYELYWEKGPGKDGRQNRVLEKRGYREPPGAFARWEVLGMDAYGTSPGMDALGDCERLQDIERDMATALDAMIRPPMLTDVTLTHSPLALNPGERTTVPNLSTSPGAKPIFTVNPDFKALEGMQRAVQERIQQTFYNFLFTGITNLQTTRSASEIEARIAEKLTLLGGVLKRFENEVLDPLVTRIFSIMDRNQMFLPLPEQYEGATIEPRYTSLLATAQRAAGTAPTEQLLGLIGNIAPIFQDAPGMVNIEALIRGYASATGVPPKQIKSAEEIAEQKRAQAEQAALAQIAESAQQLTQAGRNLSETDVGGGQNALQAAVEGV